MKFTILKFTLTYLSGVLTPIAVLLIGGFKGIGR